ncbi:MAG: hypothetical protein ACFE0P_13295 [Oceanicaulis sp.]
MTSFRTPKKTLEERRAPKPGDGGLLDKLEDGQSTTRLAMMLAAAALGAAALVAILTG